MLDTGRRVVGDTRPVPVKVCRVCGAVGEFPGFMRPCPACRGERA